MMESEPETIELDEFEQFRFHAHSPSHMMGKPLDPIDSMEEGLTPDPAKVNLFAPLPSHSPKSFHSDLNDGDGEEDMLLRKEISPPSPIRPHLERNNHRLGRSYSCRPRVRPRRVSEESSAFRGSRGRIHSLVTELNEIKDISRHGSITSTTRLEGGGEIYRVRSFTIHHKGFINRGDSFKIRSPSCRRSLIRRRRDSIQSLTGMPLQELGQFAKQLDDDSPSPEENIDPVPGKTR